MKLLTQTLLLFILFSLSVPTFSQKVIASKSESFSQSFHTSEPGNGGTNSGNEGAPSSSGNEEEPSSSGSGNEVENPGAELPPNNPGAESFHACDPNNRQQACTFEYIPVCGYIHNCEGGACTLTFGNDCAACAEENVDGYVEGACEDIQTFCDANDRPGACPLIYTATCAVAANCEGSHCFEDTSNSCMACSMDGVAYSLPGACPYNDRDDRTYCDASNRPEICTADYNPVCAHRSNCVGNTCYFTAGNACGACGDESVDWHIPGECSYDELGENENGEDENEERTYCPVEDRPEICTADYTPVCAHRANCEEGGDCFYTAGNACSACGDVNVDWHIPGECPPGYAEDDDGGDYENNDDDDEENRTYCDPDNRQDFCTLDYTPVCAHYADCEGDSSCYFTAGNACGACADDRVDYHIPGEC